MGRIFSRPVSSAAPTRAPGPALVEGDRTSAVLPIPSAQRDLPVRPSPLQYGSATTQGILIGNGHPSPSVTASHLERSSTNPTWGDPEQDGTTVGDSPISPRTQGRKPPSGRAHNSPFDVKFSEVHPDTRKEVFRWGSFGDKHAVQIVCDHLLEGLREATGSFDDSSHKDTPFAPASWIMEPYEPIVHNKQRIESYRSSLEDDDVRKHLDWFLGFLEFHQPGAWAKFDEVQSGSCQRILFRHLWVLYPPRTTVFKKDDGIWRAYMVERCEIVMDAKETLRIHAWYLDFNRAGDRLVPHGTTFEVPSFSSERPIRMLELIPEWFIQPADSIRQKLISRGKLHWSYRNKPCYQEYSGTLWPQRPHEVIVDYSTSSRCPEVDDRVKQKTDISCCFVCIGDSLGLYSYPREASNDSAECVNNASHLPMSPTKDLEDESAFLFCPPKLWVFCLRLKSWGLVSHEHLHDVETDKSFDGDLYMKDRSRKESLDDIVSAYMKDGKFVEHNKSLGRKGRGLNILLVGDSGTGKTYTAECLSRKYGVALYSVNCGDLGVQADLLDQRLLDTFTRATNWNAMVLLDDFDIYRPDRNAFAYKRAALLPTFLRHLEYSDCLTFIGMASLIDSDPALPSRIHLVIPFPRLDFDSQREIWHLLIGKLDLSSTNKRNMTEFINHTLWTLDIGKHRSMNAWQIRNCLDVAVALARKEASGTTELNLQSRHIQTVLKLGEAFRAHVLQEGEDSMRENLLSMARDSSNPFED